MTRSRIVLLALLALLALALRAAVAVAAVPRQQPPLFEPSPHGPFPLGEAPTAVLAGSFGFETDGFEKNLLIGYAGGDRANFFYAGQDRPGLFQFRSLRTPTGPSVFAGDVEEVVILSPTTDRAGLYEFDIYHGRLRSKTIVRTQPDPVAVAVADVSILEEASNTRELVVADRRTGQLQLFSRDTPFRHPAERLHPIGTVPLGPEPTAVVAPECCGPEIFATTAGDNRLTLLSEFRDGDFLNRRSFRVGRRPVAVATTGSTNGIRSSALVAVANRDSDNVTILVGTGVPTAFHVAANYPVGDEPVAVAVLDIDHREGPDVAVANAGSDDVTILLNNGRGSLRSGGTYPVGDRPVALAPFQFDRSFDPDLAVVNRGSGDLTVLLRRVDGNCRGREAQRLVGTNGSDRLVGRGEGPNQTKGRGGDDRIDGGRGGDCLSGEGGDDIIRGGTQGDLIEGGPGDDKLLGEGMIPFSQASNDTILGGPGEDRIKPGWGADHVLARDDERDRIDCGYGLDVAVVDRADIVRNCERVDRR
jgi:RTX calcium-binding nonapeptide repeat (4 copies)